MSRPQTPVAGAYDSIPPIPDSASRRSASHRSLRTGSRPTSYVDPGAPEASGYEQEADGPMANSVPYHNAITQQEADQTGVDRNSQLQRSASQRSLGQTSQRSLGQTSQRSAGQTSQKSLGHASEKLPSGINTPSRGNTLKKKASLQKSGSVKRSASRKSSHAGSVRSLKLGEKEKFAETEESNSVFFCPVPTTGNPTELLANRFTAWRKVLKDLINYFRDVHRSSDAKQRALQSANETINTINTPQYFMSNGGLGDASGILKEFHRLALNEAIKARDLENEVILQLTGLENDLKQKIREIKGLSGDFKNSVDKEQQGTKKIVHQYQEAVRMVDSNSAGATGKHDPFVVKMGVDRQVEKQIEEENYLHRAYLNLEASGRELESIIVGEIQKAYNVLAGILRREADHAYDAAERLKEGPIALERDREWDYFVTHDKQMVDPRHPLRKATHISYPGKDHPAAIEVKSGMLERKSKYLKNYTPGWYILSPTHLHEYKSADRIAAQAPVMSLFLPEQKLGSHSEFGSTSHKFMLKGRQTGSMHRGHSWVFRAETHDTMMAWFNDVKELTEKTGEARNEFVRRQHARSLSGNSLKAPSVASSADGMEEDEADRTAFAGEQTVRGPSYAEGATGPEGVAINELGADDNEDARSDAGWRPQRPAPGGKFPSDLNVSRGLQAPQSPSSGGSDDRDAIAAAGNIPGSGMPYQSEMGPQTGYQPYQTGPGPIVAGQMPQTDYQEYQRGPGPVVVGHMPQAESTYSQSRYSSVHPQQRAPMVYAEDKYASSQRSGLYPQANAQGGYLEPGYAPSQRSSNVGPTAGTVGGLEPGYAPSHHSSNVAPQVIQSRGADSGYAQSQRSGKSGEIGPTTQVSGPQAGYASSQRSANIAPDQQPRHLEPGYAPSQKSSIAPHSAAQASAPDASYAQSQHSGYAPLTAGSAAAAGSAYAASQHSTKGQQESDALAAPETYANGDVSKVAPQTTVPDVVEDGTNQPGDWRAAPTAAAAVAGSGVGAGIASAAEGNKQVESQPIETIDNSERQMEASSAVPAYGTSSVPIPVEERQPTPTPAVQREPSPSPVVERQPSPSPSRARGMTESTETPTVGSQYGAAGSSSTDAGTISTVPTSTGQAANTEQQSETSQMKDAPTLQEMQLQELEQDRDPMYDERGMYIGPLSEAAKNAPFTRPSEDFTAQGKTQLSSGLHFPGDYPATPEATRDNEQKSLAQVVQPS